MEYLSNDQEKDFGEIYQIIANKQIAESEEAVKKIFD